MKRVLLLGLLVVAATTAPAAVASPAVRLTIIHIMQGCHVWANGDGTVELGAVRTLKAKPGTRLSVRISCPMDFDVVQTAGPKLALGDPRWRTGTAHLLVLKRKGVYRLQATNVQTPEEVGLQTMGPVNVLKLTIRVG